MRNKKEEKIEKIGSNKSERTRIKEREKKGIRKERKKEK